MIEFFNRFKEPSSWAGISVLLSFVFPMIGLTGTAASAVTAAGSALAAALAIILKEKS